MIDPNDILTDEELARIYRAGRDNRDRGDRAAIGYVLSRLAFACPLRVSEFILLKGRDLRADEGQLVTYRKKAGRDYQKVVVNLEGAAIRALQWYIERQGTKGEDRVFAACVRTIRRAWEDLLGSAGVRHRRIHSIRHTVGSRLVRAGYVKHAQTLLGHSSPATTLAFYAVLEPEDISAAIRETVPMASD